MLDLIIVVVASVLLVPLALLTSGAFRVVVALACVLFFPGYSLVAALFPAKGRFDGIERLALSLGLSLALVPLIGLLLNFTPWGIRLEPIMYSLVGFTLAMTGLAFVRRSKLRPHERFDPDIGGAFLRMRANWAQQGRWSRLLSLLLAVALMGTVGAVAYAVQKPRAADRFTEFYILGPGGKAVDYPRELVVGQGAQVIVGIANHELEAGTYRVEVDVDGGGTQKIGPIALKNDEKWEQAVSLTAAKAGAGQRVEFRLYRGADSTPYRELGFTVNATGR